MEQNLTYLCATQFTLETGCSKFIWSLLSSAHFLALSPTAISSRFHLSSPYLFDALFHNAKTYFMSIECVKQRSTNLTMRLHTMHAFVGRQTSSHSIDIQNWNVVCLYFLGLCSIGVLDRMNFLSTLTTLYFSLILLCNSAYCLVLLKRFWYSLSRKITTSSICRLRSLSLSRYICAEEWCII